MRSRRTALHDTLLLFGATGAVWHHPWIEAADILVAETAGVDGRESDYSDYGALRDMIENHVMQLLCLIAMEPPAVAAARSVDRAGGHAPHRVRAPAAGRAQRPCHPVRPQRRGRGIVDVDRQDHRRLARSRSADPAVHGGFVRSGGRRRVPPAGTDAHRRSATRTKG